MEKGQATSRLLRRPRALSATEPYLASRGLKGLQVYEEGGISDATLKEHIVMSYDLVVAGISKKKRAELGLAK